MLLEELSLYRTSNIVSHRDETLTRAVDKVKSGVPTRNMSMSDSTQTVFGGRRSYLEANAVPLFENVWDQMARLLATCCCDEQELSLSVHCGKEVL